MNHTKELQEEFVEVEIEQDYDELLQSLHEAVEWARGERQLRTIIRSTDDEFYRPPSEVEVEESLNGHAVLIALEPDVAAVYPDAESVNNALRRLIEADKEKTPIAA
jgi:hypothetical protein